eukprot:15480533-Alexandrium_andersonii.AAC.1
MRRWARSAAVSAMYYSRIVVRPAPGPNVADWARRRQAAAGTDCAPWLGRTVPPFQGPPAHRRADV